MEKLRFLSPKQVGAVATRFGTPVFVYSQSLLNAQVRRAMSTPAPYGLSVRYAMKANPHRSILRLCAAQGVAIDASSGHEAERALAAGIKPAAILLTSQELPANLTKLIEQGVKFNATSLLQLETYGKLFAGTEVSVRFNPGLGSGHSLKTNVGGSTSSFGIWYEYLGEVRRLLIKYRLRLVRLHTHIGSGTDPSVWAQAAAQSLRLAAKFDSVTILNLGGGFRVGRMSYDQTVDLEAMGHQVSKLLEQFATTTGRKLHLEIEPGTFLVANAGSLVSRIHDIVDTGAHGYSFIKIDSGMTELLRPVLYGAHHPLVVVGKQVGQQDYVVVGHACESADLITIAKADSKSLEARRLATAAVGDYLIIEGTGAYCATMSATGYNSFPRAAEVLLTAAGKLRLISRRQTLKELTSLER